MSVDADTLSGLRTLIVRQIREQLGLHERLALPLADAIVRSLQRSYGGQQIRIPTQSRVDRYQAIRDAKALGASVDEICTDLAVGRATVYRALNGGEEQRA
jgi:hypothetical protein